MGGHVAGDPLEILTAMTAAWSDRAARHVEASPQGHVMGLLAAAREAGALTPVDDSTSDGYHTFAELYRHRMLLTAALFKDMEIRDLVRSRGEQFLAHKSMLHHDGEAPFGGGWFIVVAQLPTGQISYHYPLEHWDLFKISERERAAEWDGHDAAEAADRLQWWLES